MHSSSQAAVQQHDPHDYQKLDALTPPVCVESLLTPRCLERIQAMFAPDTIIHQAAEAIHARLLDTQTDEQRKGAIEGVIRWAIGQIDDKTAKSMVVLSQERQIKRLEAALEEANAELMNSERIQSPADFA